MISTSFLRSAPVRYGLALAAMLTAVALRSALIPIIGLNVPYVTIFPAMMVTAVTLGAGPALLATVAGVLLAEYHFMQPGRPIEWGAAFAIRSAIMLLTSFYVGWVSERLRRARTRADAEAATARTAEAALRQQVELIDPARAEVIRQEMQRVLQARQPRTTPSPPTSGRWLRRVPDLAGFTVAAVGLLVMAGWVFDVVGLKRVLPGLATMKFNTALCLLLAGAALAWRERRALRWTCAAVVGIVAALSLAEELTGASFGLDQLFIHDPGDPLTIPGRMAQSTAVALLVSSATLLLLGARGRTARWAQQALSLGAGLIPLVVLLGYAYQSQQLYRFGGLSTMALPTAVTLALLAAGLVCARTDGWVSVLMSSGPGVQLARRLLPAALLAPALLGWLHVRGEQAGLFGPVLATGLFTLAMILSLTVLVWFTARALDRTDAARQDTETQLRSQAELMDQAREALIVREIGGVIRFWNRGAQALYGWPAAEALGQRTHVLLRTAGIPGAEIDAQLDSTGRWEGELLHATCNGRTVTVESRQTATHAADGRLLILESNRDITERKHAERALQRANQELEQRVAERTAQVEATARYARSLLEASLDPLVTISAEGKITDVNDASVQATGQPREQLIGTDFSDYFTEPDQAREGYRRVFAQGFVRDYPLAIRHVSGRVTDVLYNATVYRNEAGEVQGVFAAARDVTERNRAETELARYRDHLEDLVKVRTAELARSNEELEQFAYVASHDLQEPLRAVTGYLGLIQQRLGDKLDEKGRHHIEGAVQGATRMATLISDLLALSRVGTQGGPFQATNLAAVLEQTLHDLRPDILAAGATVTSDPLPTVPADAGQMAQLFRNLIGNALKFRGERPPQVHLSARRDTDGWVLGVRDNGLGIEPQYFERIFVIFQRLHTRQQYPGTGIGLAICKKIVERHGGRIWVESQPGQGSTFYLTLPHENPKA